ncbi:glycine betaine ABC transporter substrate-binding protein [Lichenicola cladoniae]|uniref:glycine betaine ABC transporter substrate-binding protein n=1 Tax=Lichenicola cladoniae TaxID=1484109 RepID=UPI001EF4D0B4|nr:glycine betaine ABC transporter substrate-binding protein [Lichenicola cladoniae]
MSFISSLTLGHLDNRQHEAAAAAVLRVLEAHDIEVEMVAGDRDTLFSSLRDGNIDLLATAWLPDIDPMLADPATAEILGSVLYRPYLLWAVPASLDIAGLRSIADLSKPDIASVIDHAIVLPRRLETYAIRVLAAYDLEQAGYRLDVLDDEAAYAHASTALDATAARVLPLWQPHALAHGGRLRPLDDPRAALPARQEAKLLLRTGLRASLDPHLLDELGELTLGNPVVSALEYAMRTDGMTADEAAEAWQRGRLTPRA